MRRIVFGPFLALALAACGGSSPSGTGGSGGQGGSDPLLCKNGQLGEQESDVDCGSATCPPCKEGKKCGAIADCEDGLSCSGGTCQDLCANGVEDDGECEMGNRNYCSDDCGVACLHCDEVLGGGDSATLCTKGKKLWDAAVDCMCNGACKVECGPALCADNGPSQDCESCILSASGCGAQFEACQMDSGV